MYRSENMLNNKKIRLIISLIISGFLISILCWSTCSNIFILNTICLWGLGWLYLAICFYNMTFNYCTRKEMNLFKHIVYKFISFSLSAILIILCPIKYGEILESNYYEKMYYVNNVIHINPLSEMNASATADELWIEKIEVNGKVINLNEIKLAKGWTILDDHIYAASAKLAEPLEIVLPHVNSYKLYFTETEASGKLEYLVGDKKIKKDLYSKDRRSVFIESKEIWGHPDNTHNYKRYIYYVTYFMLLWFIIDPLCQYIFDKSKKRKELINSYNK